MSWFSELFNLKSYPKTISALPIRLLGEVVDSLCGKDTVSYPSTSYYVVSICAKLKKEKKYDLFAYYHTDYIDIGRCDIQKDLSLVDTIHMLRKFEKHYKNDIISFKRGKDNVDKVANHLHKKGILRH